jgi:hypothetical protein
MNKNTSVTMAAAMAVAGILTLALLTMAIQHQAFAQAMQGGDDHNKCCDNDKKQKEVAVGGNGGSGGAGGAGGEGGQGGKNIAKDNGCCKSGNTKIDQDANGGYANGGHGGNANGGDARA